MVALRRGFGIATLAQFGAQENRCRRAARICAIFAVTDTGARGTVSRRGSKNDVQTKAWGKGGAIALSCLTPVHRRFAPACPGCPDPRRRVEAKKKPEPRACPARAPA
jgi:hypothetical protein